MSSLSSVSQSSGRRRKDKGRGLELYVPPQLRDRKKQNCELPKATKDTEDTIQGLCELEKPQNQFLHMHSITVAVVDILDNSNQPLRLNEENINGEKYHCDILDLFALCIKPAHSFKISSWWVVDWIQFSIIIQRFNYGISVEPALFIKGLGSDEMHDPEWISNELKV
uniref:Enhancer of zeste3 n=1 Tax=Heterorhabditis bacteriophora TaxID=37862 RepID=A0A1I7WE59_HETBA